MSNLLSYLPHIIYACIFISRISTWLLFLLSYSDIAVLVTIISFNSWLFLKYLKDYFKLFHNVLLFMIIFIFLLCQWFASMGKMQF